MTTSQLYPGQFRQPTQLFRDSFNSRGHMEIEVSSQISPPYVGHFVRNLNGENLLTVPAAINDVSITVNSVVGAVIGQGVIITDAPNISFYIGHITDIIGNVIYVDAPINRNYSIADALVGFLTHEMNVDGSVTPVVFGVRAGEPISDPLVTVEVDITRILCSMITTDITNLLLFGDQPALTNGCTLRKNNGNGTYDNIITIKSNQDLVSFAYDMKQFEQTNPIQGVNGIAWRMTFGGEEKMGTVIRINHLQDLEWVIRDDLTLLLGYENIAEGALVLD